MLSGSTRSVVVLIKYFVWETVHHNAFASKISSERRSRRFYGCKHRPATRLEWLRRNLKFRCGTLRYRGETGVRRANFFFKSVPASAADMMAVLDLIDGGAKLAANFFATT